MKYLLAPAELTGHVAKADASVPRNEVNWVVDLHYDNTGAAVLRRITQVLVSTSIQFALVVDGRVAVAAGVEGVIVGGVTRISGNLSRAEAQTLAAQLS